MKMFLHLLVHALTRRIIEELRMGGASADNLVHLHSQYQHLTTLVVLHWSGLGDFKRPLPASLIFVRYLHLYSFPLDVYIHWEKKLTS